MINAPSYERELNKIECSKYWLWKAMLKFDQQKPQSPTKFEIKWNLIKFLLNEIEIKMWTMSLYALKATNYPYWRQ